MFDLYDHDIIHLFQLRDGEVSNVFAIEEFYFVVYVISHTEATDLDIEEAFIQFHISAHRADSIDDLVENWVANANYTINQAALDAMR